MTLSHRIRPALVALAALLAGAVVLPADDVEWRQGTQFERALENGLSIFRERAELREMLERLSEVTQVACVLDRRIDPSRKVSLQLSSVPLRAVLDELAQQAGSAAGVLGSTMVIGPPEELDRLLTAAAAGVERVKQGREISAARRLELTRARDIAWEDLDRPRDIVQRIADDWNLVVEKPETIPHDLWAAGEAAGLNAVEALTLVLGQFDLGIELRDAGNAVRIVPLPAVSTVARLHRPVGMSREAALGRLRSAFPDVATEPVGAALRVTASVLTHDRISLLLGEVQRAEAKPAEPVPLSQRRFPVRVVRKPVGALLEALQMQGIDIRYDPDALRAAGIDLEKLVSLEFENATAEELFDALCRPAGLTYTIEGSTVTISPANLTPSETQ